MEEVNQIMSILEGKDEGTQKEILVKCAAKLGSKEWEEAIKDFWERMEILRNK